MGALKLVSDGMEDIIRAKNKQRLINYVERQQRVDFRFYESNSFLNVEILFAPEHELRELINNLPEGFYCQISARTNRLEIFCDEY